MTDQLEITELNNIPSGQVNRDLFDSVGVSLWLEDFTAVKALLDSLRARGIHDIRTYLQENPRLVHQAVELVRIVDVNQETVNLFAATDKSDLLRSLADIGLADAAEVFAEELVALAEGRDIARMEVPLRRLDGAPLIGLFNVNFRHDTGDYSRVVVTLTDITDLKQAEAATAALDAASHELAVSLDYEQTLASVARVLVPQFADWCAVDLLDGNGELQRLAVAHGDPEKVAYAQELQRKYPPDRESERGAWHVIRTGRAEMMSEIPQELLELTAYDEEHLRILKELQLRSYICVPIVVAGQPAGVISLIMADSGRTYDEGDLKVAREIGRRASQAIENARLHSEAQESEARYRNVVQSLQAAVYMTDAEGRITLYNDAAVKLWGREPELGKDLWCGSWRIYRADGSPMELDECPMAVTVKERRSTREEVIVERPDGTRVPVMPYPEPLFDSSGRLVGALNLLADLTESKEAQATLERQLRQQQIIYGLSAAVTRAAAVEDITEAALDGLISAVGADRASVLLFDDDDVMRFKGWRGLSEEYRAAVEGHTPWKPADRDARPITMSDISAEEDLGELKDTILGEGIHAVAFIPLLSTAGVLGKFMIYFDQPHVFEFGEIQLCEAIAGHVAHAIERTRAEDSLRQSEERYRAVVEGQVEMLCRFRADGMILFANEAYGRAVGRPSADLTGEDFWHFIPEDDRPAIQTLLDRLTPEAPEVSIENRLELQDGVHWTLWSNRGLLFDEEGRLLEAQSSGIDITERKKAEQQLRESEERFRQVVEAAPNGIVLADVDGTIVMANPEAERSLGYERGELVGERIEILVPERFAGQHKARRDHFFLTPSTRPMGAGRDLFARRKDGSEFPVEIGLNPVNTPQGPRVLATIVDITERKRAEEEMAAATALKDQFLGLVSHELRTPIATVLGNSTLLLNRGQSLDERDRVQALEDIRTEAARLQDIIENLLILSRIEGSGQLEFEPVALRHLISERIRAFSRRAPSREIRLIEEARDIVVSGEQALLAVVIDNLISNAIKYSPHGTPVEVVLDRTGGANVSVTVRDYGIGLDESEIAKIFQPFYRSNAGRDFSKGMGLGLASCKRIAEAHGGDITARGMPDAGSEFSLTLPAAPRQPVRGSERAEAM